MQTLEMGIGGDVSYAGESQITGILDAISSLTAIFSSNFFLSSSFAFNLAAIAMITSE